jgi:serine/threonine protein kinase
LAIARQIADALETAHEQGIVHRDLKPANIKIRLDGTVKVLDFGIAKILDSRADARSDSLRNVGGTAEGLLIGTAPYMSPEQARGGTVTRRSDIWAFGAILFEMLTGQRAFAGQTTSDVLAAILERMPDWRALPPATPPSIARLIRRCLEHEPKARLHDIGDARRRCST